MSARVTSARQSGQLPLAAGGVMASTETTHLAQKSCPHLVVALTTPGSRHDEEAPGSDRLLLPPRSPRARARGLLLERPHRELGLLLRVLVVADDDGDLVRRG